MDGVIPLLTGACLSGIVAYDVSCTKAGAPVRALVHRLSKRWYVEVIDCQYCLSHWTSFAIALAMGLRVPVGLPVLDFLLAWATLTALASPVMVLVDWSTDAVGLIARCKHQLPEAPEGYESSDVGTFERYFGRGKDAQP